MSRDSTGFFLDSIARYPLLTAAQEIELSRQIARMIELRDSGKKKFTKAEQRTMKIGQRAKTKLMRHNIRLVVHIARRFHCKGVHESMEMMDFVQEGIIGLDRAAERFDGTKGYKFSTYAHWWIKQALRRAVDNKARMIRVPVHAMDKIHEIYRFTEEYLLEHDAYPTIAQIAEKIEMTEEWVRLLMERAKGTSSLDIQIGHSEEISLAGSIPDPASLDLDSQYDDLDTNEMWQHVKAGIERLPERERDVVVMRYGLDSDFAIHTLQEIGERYGWCRERSRQLLNRATNRLKNQASRFAHQEPPQSSYCTSLHNRTAA